MKKALVGALGLSLFLAAALMANSCIAQAADRATTPTTHNNAKWRFAYYQGGPYVDYQTILKAVVNGLIDLGWIPPTSLPAIDDPQDTRTLWTWLSKNIKSQYIDFVEDAYYSADWDKEKRPKIRGEFIARLNEKKDIDYILAFGTWAGQDLANNEHSTPVEVISTSDPLGSGIIKSVEDSGFDHVHAKVEPTRYEKQVRLFNDIIPFKRLGVVYEDTKEGRTYAAIDKVETVAKERGFEIMPCLAPFAGISDQQATENVLTCHNTLAPKVDAVYITVHRGVNTKTLGKLLAPLNKQKIPTFSQSGSPEVKCGVLLSIAQAAFKYAGRFHAEAIARVLNGSKPRSLPQMFDAPPKIAINLVTAQLIGYDPPVDLLGAADEIYNTIEGASQGE